MPSLTLDTLVEILDPEGFRVIKTPDLIFLCGGKIRHNGEPTHPSARSHFYEFVQNDDSPFRDRVVLAEKTIQWFDTNIYQDLLTFESDLGALSRAVVLFVESAGSIAELGAFSLLEGVNTKLIAVVDASYQDEESFIRFGPLQFLETVKRRRAYYFPGFTEDSRDESDLLDISVSLYETLKITLNSGATEQKFRPDSTEHILLLIADIVELCHALKLREIRDTVQHLLKPFGRTEANLVATDKRIRQLLLLLERTGIISKSRFASETYYVAPKRNTFIRLEYKKGASVRDRIRVQSDLAEHFEAHDPDRLKAFRRRVQLD